MKNIKLILLILSYLLAYLLFSQRDLKPLHDFISSLGYIGTFIAGIFYAYSFTAAFATALLLILAKQQNIALACLVAGLGSLLSDAILFSYLRVSFSDRIRNFCSLKGASLVKHKVRQTIRHYLLEVVGIIIIASPLPDELGVGLLSFSTINKRKFYVISYIANTLGILIILIFGLRL